MVIDKEVSMKLICFGDSIAAGYPFGEENSIASVISEKNGLDSQSMGYPGLTSGEILGKSGDVAGVLPDVILIICGSDDITYGVAGPRAVHDNIMKMADVFGSHGIHVIIASPPACYPKDASKIKSSDYSFGMHCGEMPGAERYRKYDNQLDMLHALLKESCNNKKISFIDLYEILKNYSRFHDCIHPTREIYQYMGTEIAHRLDEIERGIQWQ